MLKRTLCILLFLCLLLPFCACKKEDTKPRPSSKEPVPMYEYDDLSQYITVCGYIGV